jgi:hypothetical protein
MRAVTFVVVLSLLGGCFANAQHRRHAKLGEGGAIVAGIALLSVASTGADCASSPGGRAERDDCRTQATIVGDIGLGLILAGLAGFIVTTSMTPDETPPPKPSLANKPQPTTIAKPPAAIPAVQ